MQAINKAKSLKNFINIVSSWINLLENAVDPSWLIILKPRFVVFFQLIALVKKKKSEKSYISR